MGDLPDIHPATIGRSARRPWLARCARGLFRVTADELKFRKVIPPGSEPLVLRQRSHDLLFVQRALRAPHCALIRTAEEILRCLVYGRYKLSKAQLDLLAKELDSTDEPYQIAVSVEGTHFVRRDVRQFLQRELVSRGARIDVESPHLLFVFCVDAAYYLGTIQSQEADAEFRRFRVAERPGSLPPTIAAAMAFLGRLRPGDTVLDLVCGSGTLLAEAYGYCQDLTLVGVDADPSAASVARTNLAFIPSVRILHHDSTSQDLPIPPHSVDAFLANLPFGKQFGDRDTNVELYPRLLAQLTRLGLPGRWRAVLLTADDRAMQAGLAANPDLHVTKSLRIHTRGEAATIYVVQPGVQAKAQTITVT